MLQTLSLSKNYNLRVFISSFGNPQSGVKGDASPLQVKGRALVAEGETSARSAETLRAGAQLLRAKHG